MPQGVLEIITTGAAAADRTEDQARSLVEREPASIVRTIAQHSEGEGPAHTVPDPDWQEPHVVDPAAAHLAQPDAIDCLHKRIGRQAKRHPSARPAAVEPEDKTGLRRRSAVVVGVQAKAA